MGGNVVKIELPYVQAFTARDREFSYYRRGGKRTRINGAVGSREWMNHYQRIHDMHEGGAVTAPINGTFAALVAEYRAAPAFTELKPRTQKDYAKHLGAIVDRMGGKGVAGITRPDILRIRDKYAENAGARQADYLISVIALLLTFGVDRGYRQDHPARRIKKIYRAQGHRPWDDWEIEKFRQHWALGTWERTAFEILLNTGQRKGDVCIMAQSQVQGGNVMLRQGKTGEWLVIPQSKRLSEALEAYGRRGVTILIGDKGAPVKEDHFGHRLAEAFKTAGLSGVTIHGLRYTAGTILKELDVDEELIGSILGHKTLEMIRKYTRQKRNAKAAISAMDNAEVSNTSKLVSNGQKGNTVK